MSDPRPTPRLASLTNGLESGQAGDPEQAPTARLDQLFRGERARIQLRLAIGDPLQLGRRIDEALDRRCLILDRRQIHLDLLMRCARDGGRLGPKLLGEAWLEERVQEAIESALASASASAAAALDHDSLSPASNESSFDEFPAREQHVSSSSASVRRLARQLGVPHERFSRGCVEFNRLPLLCRETFFRCVIEDRPLEQLVRPGGPTLSTLATAARRALVVLAQLNRSRGRQSDSKAPGVEVTGVEVIGLEVTGVEPAGAEVIGAEDSAPDQPGTCSPTPKVAQPRGDVA